MSKQIEIRISPSGEIQAVTKNIKGRECLSYIRPLEELLEARTVDSEFTPEYYQTEEILEGSVLQEVRNNA